MKCINKKNRAALIKEESGVIIKYLFGDNSDGYADSGIVLAFGVMLLLLLAGIILSSFSRERE